MNLADYVSPLVMNGLHGRMLKVPGPRNKQKEILLVYGLHASLERMFSFAEDLSQYGTVTMPDLPGFGGMDSFYKIGEKPTIDNLADYLAAFVKLRYKRKRVSILAMSYGFIVVTRMLQKYPKLIDKVDLLVSLAGFVHHDDFNMKKFDRAGIRTAAKFASFRAPAWYVRNAVLRPTFVKATYRLMAKNHRKLHDADKDELERRITFEAQLWQMNDAQTKGKVVGDMFKVDLCNERVDLPVHHVYIANDHFFDNHIVEQHMRVIYSDFEAIEAVVKGNHAPSVIATAEEVAPLVPKKLRKLLAKK